jgi:serine/threonine-protein kinase RsbW
LRVFYASISGDFNKFESTVRDVIKCLMTRNCTIMENTLFEIRVILNELITNAYKHGNKGDFRKHITVRAGMIRGEYALFAVEDEGEGYDYRLIFEEIAKRQNDRLLFCNVRENGRGLMIVNCLCDKMNFNKSGNKVTVLKKL